MKREKAQQIGDIVRRFFRQNGLESPLNEHRLMASWGEVVGESFARCASPTGIRNQVLYVKVSSAVLRHELTMGRSILVQHLNQKVGAQVIVDIRFY